MLYRETVVDPVTHTGNAVNYIFLGKKLVAKEGAIAASGSSEQHYKPFGETIEAPRDDVGYTGHKFDTDLGLSYIQARYYDPKIGRFYGVDPVGYRDVHSFNRFAYANNNPYRYTDPDGRDSDSVLRNMRGYVSDGVISQDQYFDELQTIGASNTIALGAVIAGPVLASSTSVGSVTTAIVGKAALGASLAGSADFVNQKINNNNGEINVRHVLASMTLGALAAQITPGTGFVAPGINATEITVAENIVANTLTGSVIGGEGSAFVEAFAGNGNNEIENKDDNTKK